MYLNNDSRLGKHGSVMVTTILFLPVLISFAIGAVDVGYLNTEKSRMQTVADMATVSALGNVDWNTSSVEEEKTEIISNINAFITVNGYNPTLFGTPAFEDDGDNVTKVTLDQTVPVQTFFWSFIQPGSNSLDVHLKSSAEAEYDSTAKVPAPDFGLYAFNDLTLQSGQVQVGSYKSSNGEVLPTKKKDMGNIEQYYDIVVGAGGDFSTGTELYGDVYANSVSGTIYGEVVAETDSGSATVYERPDPDPDYDYDPDYILNNTSASSVEVQQLSQPEIILPTEQDMQDGIDDGSILSMDYFMDQGVVNLQNGNYSLANKAIVTLEAGKSYYFPPEFLDKTSTKEWFEVVGSGDGVNIYTSGSFHASGHFYQGGPLTTITNISPEPEPGDPRDEFKFTGQSLAYFDFIGPHTDVTVKGNGTVYGRVYAHDIDIQSVFVYDKDLAGHGYEWDGPPAVSIKAHLTE